MNRELNRLTFMLILAFGLAAISTFFWTVIQRDSLLARDDNPRKVIEELNVQRGTIFDRHNQILAYTQAAENPTIGATRIYPHPEVVSAVGYYSYQYGQSALEEGYDEWLRAVGLTDTTTEVVDHLLNHPTVGGDVLSTLDLDLQIALHDAMAGYSGAGLVAHVPSGDVLAMVSLPDYDPNHEEVLRNLVGEREESEPTPNPATINTRLLNRVTTGQYQPGGALETLLMSTLLANGYVGTGVVRVDDVTLESPELTLTCSIDTDESEITLAEAYRRGCPRPFIEAVGKNISTDAFKNILQAAGFFGTPELGGFLLPTTPRPAVGVTNNLPANAAGQGALTVTPLQMAQVIAAILNKGNGIPLHLADAIRYPEDSPWEPISTKPSPIAIMQANIAQTIEGILRRQSFSEDIPIYGHLSRAYAGDREYVWFLGWTPLEDGSNVLITLVLEGNTVTLQSAIDVAVQVLSLVEASTQAIQSPN